MNNSKKQQQNNVVTVEKLSNSKSEEQQKQKHLQLLHEYNDLKDATQTVLGALAQAKGLPVKDIYKMYNLPNGDWWPQIMLYWILWFFLLNLYSKNKRKQMLVNGIRY